MLLIDLFVGFLKLLLAIGDWVVLTVIFLFLIVSFSVMAKCAPRNWNVPRFQSDLDAERYGDAPVQK